MKKRIAALLCCLLLLTACGEKAAPVEEMPIPAATESIVETTQPTVPETTEPAGPELLTQPVDGKVCVGFIPTEAGSWRYVEISDQEAAVAAYEKATGAIYSDEWWIKGDRTRGLMVVYGEIWDFVESGELVYSLGRVKAEDAADLYALCAAAAAEAGWREPVSPEQLTGIVSATLRQGETEIPLTDGVALDKLEAMLAAGEYSLGGTGCPFTVMLDVETEAGVKRTIALATDSCAVWMSEGYYYEYGIDSKPLFDLFGVTLNFGKIAYGTEYAAG